MARSALGTTTDWSLDHLQAAYHSERLQAHRSAKVFQNQDAYRRRLLLAGVDLLAACLCRILVLPQETMLEMVMFHGPSRWRRDHGLGEITKS
jgi:hypothetical protein